MVQTKPQIAQLAQRRRDLVASGISDVEALTLISNESPFARDWAAYHLRDHGITLPPPPELDQSTGRDV